MWGCWRQESTQITAPIWMLLTQYPGQEHRAFAPIPSALCLTPRGRSAPGERAQSSHKPAPGRQHPPSAGAGSLAGAGALLVPPALISPLPGAEGTGGPVLFHPFM